MTVRVVRVLFGVSSVGLGHAARSYRVVERLRELAPACVVRWLCAEPAASLLQARNEALAATSRPMRSLTPLLEDETHNGKVANWFRLLRRAVRVIDQNRALLAEALTAFDPDIVVGDEFWEVLATRDGPRAALACPTVFLTDFLRYSVRTWNPISYIGVQYINLRTRRALERVTTLLFIGHPRAITKQRWYGITGPRLTEWASQHARIVGPVLTHDPVRLPTKGQLRRQLGLSEDGPVIVGTAGGTAAGEPLLDRLVEAHHLLRRSAPDLQTVIIGWPQRHLEPSVQGLIIRGFEPKGYHWVAAADIVVTTAGLSTLLEATSSGVRLVVAPLRNHFEQEANAQLFGQLYPTSIFDMTRSPHELAELLSRILPAPAPTPLRWDDASLAVAQEICATAARASPRA